MTFDTEERGRYTGTPVECYRFTAGARSWFFTSADRVVELPGGTFEPEAITRGDMDFSQEDTGGGTEVSVPRNNPVAELFIGEQPSTHVFLTIYRAHRNLLASPITTFVGRVSSCRFEESQATLVASSLTTFLARPVPTLTMQAVCNHVLYSTGCGADPSAHVDTILVTTVNGTTVVSNDFAVRPDEYFRGGRLRAASGETRMIVKHLGNTVTLITSLPGLASLQEVQAFAGCDHLEATCLAKFNNLVNHLGWSRMPPRNPFVGKLL